MGHPTFSSKFWTTSFTGKSEGIDCSQETQVLGGAVRFRALAALAWDKETIYPKSHYIHGSPQGQCGVTNFGFGIWLAWRDIVPPGQMFFEEGNIVRADGSLAGGNHTWLRVIVDDGCQHPELAMRLDLTGDQFPSINVPEVVQYDDYFYSDPQTSSGNRVYVANRATPLLNYDVTRFGQRLGRFMSNVCSVAGSEELPSTPAEMLHYWGLAL